MSGRVADTARVLRFGGVSGLAWVLDLGVQTALVAAGMATAPACAIAATLAATLVYIASVRRIFHYEGRFLLAKWLLWLAWQGALIAALAWSTATIERSLGMHPTLVRLLLMPLSFGVNYVVMHALTRPRARAAAAGGAA